MPQVNLKRDKVTWPGAIIQKTGEGMPNYDNNKMKGTLYVTMDVEFPRGSLSEETRDGGCGLCSSICVRGEVLGRSFCIIVQLLPYIAKIIMHFLSCLFVSPAELIRLLGQDSKQTVYNGL